jgi:hypothetical protein
VVRGAYLDRDQPAERAVARAPRRVEISRTQRDLHVAAETIAVVVAAPFSIWLALQQKYPLPQWARILSGTIGVGTLAIDGGLLFQFLKKKENTS